MKWHIHLTRTLLVILIPSAVRAAYPVIHVQWDGGGTPILGQHYTIDTTVTGTLDYPDVKLLEGHLDWRIWSTDTDNTDGYGDIGEISCPADQNFGVKIANQSDSAGARDILAIHLVPTSSSNYANITGGFIAGTFQEELTVQPTAAGVGGEVFLNISGGATIDMTLRKVNYLAITPTYSGDLVIEELAGSLDFANMSGTVTVNNVQGNDNTIRSNGPISGQIVVSHVGPGQSFNVGFNSRRVARSCAY